MANITMRNLIGRSTKATCGSFEREVIVEKRNLNKVINTIRRSGSHEFVGRGPASNPNKKTVWFNPRGGII